MGRRILHFGRWFVLLAIVVAVVMIPNAALAQASIDPTATPTRNDGGWVNWMAIASVVLGALVVFLTAAAYLRFAPRFYRSDREEEAKRTAVPAPPPTAVRIQYQPPPQPVAAAVPAAVGAEKTGAAPTAQAAEPEPVAAPASAPAAATAAAEAPPAAEAPAPAPAAAPRHEGPVELDQETFDRVLQEQLDKGTDRRVAEGRARSAAFKAGREKAGDS